MTRPQVASPNGSEPTPSRVACAVPVLHIIGVRSRNVTLESPALAIHAEIALWPLKLGPEAIRLEDAMKWFRGLVLPVLAALCFSVCSQNAAAQITVSIGVAPVCPYGYFNYAPYQCAPFGYYGPQWFTGGVFLGAGPWFRGPIGFHGYINHEYDPHFGYRGPFPGRGEHADWGRHVGWERHFRGNEYHNEVRHDNGNHYGQYKDHGDHGNAKGHDHDDHHDNGHGHDDHGHGHDDHAHGHDR